MKVLNKLKRMNACIVRFTIDNKILLVKNRNRGWEFPGGKVDYEKDKLKGGSRSNIIDLLQAATREFKEEVSEYIGCVGSPSKILFEPTHHTVIFVFKDQDCAFDCFEKYEHYLSCDPAIEEVKQFEVSEIDQLKFSFESDKQLIYDITKEV